MKKRASKYKIMTILMDSDGNVSANFVGWHASQGGREFGAGNIGCSNIDQLFKYLKYKFYEAEEDIKNEIKKREEDI